MNIVKKLVPTEIQLKIMHFAKEMTLSQYLVEYKT